MNVGFFSSFNVSDSGMRGKSRVAPLYFLRT